MELDNRVSFDTFRSSICHRIRFDGDIPFLNMIISEKWIETYWNKEWYEESFYLLAIVDYFTEYYHLEPFNQYDYYRRYKLSEIVYPLGVLLVDKISPNMHMKEKVIEECSNDPCGQKFLKYNIIEKTIRDVV